MEHHSNQTSWEETIADVVVLTAKEDGLVDPSDLEQKLQTYKDRPLKIGAFTACSNVTGISTPYHRLARIMHENGGLCFVDFAASAPYVPINMHPDDSLEKLDAITLSPHKFLGGPGSSGVLVFDTTLYNLEIPDQPGGGTVLWTNPWGGHKYYDDVELREDGGTPGFLQAIRAALAIKLKEEMDTAKMKDREQDLLARMFVGMKKIPGLHILAEKITDRLPIISFYLDSVHYNLIVRLLNDRFGIQVRGGCSCAGTYGHFLLHVDRSTSQAITDSIDEGDLSSKPGWVRASVHPTTRNDEVDLFVDALSQIQQHADEWSKEYVYSSASNEFTHVKDQRTLAKDVEQWFE
jgi:selenocysteine lyase/cysteine desulfurase